MKAFALCSALLLLLLPLHFVLPLSPSCKPQEEVLFAEDPSDRQAFLSCKAYASSPAIGFWERHFCPNDMHFELSTQQCMANKLPPNMVREANDILQIAILNGSCARGEHCIGGTVCDPLHQRCLCPFGSVAVLENLSCAKLTPLGQQFWRAQVRPSPYGPNPQAQLAIHVPPGSSCARGELCGGGSVCVPAMGICICPAHTENQNGHCLPMASKSQGSGQPSAKEMDGQGGFFKVPLGEQCNEYLGLLCADQSAVCSNGRCQCIPPLAEREGHCQMPLKESGPGELCNAGQTCTRGSVCNPQIPICVCPQETDLRGGWCIGASSSSTPLMVPIGSAESTAGTKMRPREANVGEKCSLNADCATGAYCNGNSQPPTCQCLSTHVNVNSRCEKVIYPGQRGCDTDLQCSAGYAGARCINGQCVCPPGSTAIDQSCIPAIAWPGEACNISQLMPVCSSDSYCFEGRCVCSPPLRLFQKQCIQRREEQGRGEEAPREGRQCSRHLDCGQGRQCTPEGRCQPCGRRQSRLGGNCVNLENFGGKFAASELFNDGTGEGEGGKAGQNGTNGERRQWSQGRKGPPKMGGIEQIFSALSMLRKAALDGLIGRGRGNGTGRRERRGLALGHLPHGHRVEGEPCSPGHICLNGTVCEEGHCRCPPGKSCLAPAPSFRPIGSECREGIDRCVGGSVCLRSSCSCTDGSSPNAQKTNCRQRPGGRCSAGQLCSGRTECRLGLCQCQAGLRLVAGKRKCARRVAKPGESCENGEKCTGASACGQGQVCHCPPKQKALNGTCEGSEERKGERKVFETAAGDDPEEGGDLRRNSLEGLVTARPGQSCANGEACTGGSMCRNGRVCACARGESVPAGGHSCLSKELTNLQALERLVQPGPGQLCLEEGASGCVGGSKCQQGICQCREGHTLFRGECLPPSAKMSPEKFRAQSRLFSPDSAVMDSPQPGGNPPEPVDENMLDPVPNRIVAPGAMCRLSLECPYRTECLRGVCRCKKGETILNGMCRKTIHEVLPGGRCDTQKGLDCVGESHCFYGICVCLYGLLIVGKECANADVLKPVPPGATCSQGQQCEGRARCVRGKCQCPRGQKPDSESRRCVKSPRLTTERPEPTPAHAEAEGTASASLVPLELPQMPKFIYTIPAALAAAAEEGKFNQILTANQMSINLMDQQMLRSLLAPLVQLKRGESAVESARACEGSTCLVTSPPLIARPLSPTTEGPSSAQLNGIPGHPCTPEQNCRGGALCMGHICVCRPGFRPLQGFCQISKMGLGEPCFINEQCKANGFCIDGICRCRPDFDSSPGPSPSPPFAFHRHRCPVRPVAAVGEDCSQAQNCAWNSVCGPFSGVCECAVGLESSQGTCIAARRPRGTECLSSSNCHKYGFCDNGFCICKSGHEPVGGLCLPPARLVIDDPKAYVNPDLMAVLLKKQGILAAGNGRAKLEEEENSAFGLRMARLGSGQGNELGGIWNGGGGGGGLALARAVEEAVRPWQEGAGRNGVRAEEEPLRGMAGLASSLGWPFRLGNGPLAQTDPQSVPFSSSPSDQFLQFAPANPHRMVGFSPPMAERKAKGAGGVKMLSLEERRALLERNSAGKGRGRAGHPALRKAGIAMPGEFCGNREKICLGNSVCLAGWCQCPDGIRVERGGMCAVGPGKVPSSSTPSGESIQVDGQPPFPGASHSPMKQHNSHGGRGPHKPWESCANGPCIHGANCIRSAEHETVLKLGPFCQCAPGSIFLGGQCVPRKPEMRILPIGSHCPQPAICDFGALCGEKGICQCPEGQRPVAGICVQIALPGESCGHGEFCSDGAVCAPGLDACVCPVGWKVRQGKCHRGRKMARLAQRERKRPTRVEKTQGEEEGEEEEERVLFTEMPPNSGESFPSLSSSTSAPSPAPHILVALGQVCHSDKDCHGVPKAFCPTTSRRCSCLPGFVKFYSSVCVPQDRVRYPGEDCVASAHFCSGNSWCKEGQCQCFQRDTLALNGRCQRLPGAINARVFRRHPPKAPSPILPGACQSDLDCPLGAVCHRGGDCLCNGLSLAQSLASKAAKNLAERECTLDLDCPPVLGCLQGRCVCLRMAPGSRLDLAEGKADIELDLALGEPAGPILPGSFCDAFSRCGRGAECVLGKCQCIFGGHKLAFVNGSTECVEQGHGAKVRHVFATFGHEKERSLNELDDWGKKERRARQIGGPSKSLQNCTLQPEICSGGSICLSGRCECPKGASLDGKGQCRTMAQSIGSFSSDPSMPPRNGPPQHSPTRTTPMSQKLVSPGTQCGPLDICTGGSWCVEGICLCPAGTRPSAHSDQCEALEEQKRAEQEEEEKTHSQGPRGQPERSTQAAPLNANSSSSSSSNPSSAAPSSSSAPQLIANSANNSTGLDKPAGTTQPLPCAGNSLQRCARSCPNSMDCPSPAASSSLPPPLNLTSLNSPRRALPRRPYARPSENCSNGEICTGGSICQRQTKVCECPPQKPLLRNHICIQSDEPPMLKAGRALPGQGCNSEKMCTGDSICVDGKCRCQSGFVSEGGECRVREQEEEGQSSQRSSGMEPPETRVQNPPQEMLPPAKLAAESDTTAESRAKPQRDSNSESSGQARSSSRPRVSGPPLRKASASSSSSSSSSGRQTTSAEGICPPGNVPTKDSANGQVMLCNGMTPNCPPKSYCFVTGEASETYNCCKAY